LSPDLQVKFLRVLQEREIEAIGGKKRKTNVLFIAATKRNLEEEMAAGRFRMVF
jgi:two-component system response regulator HydG